MEEGHHQPPSPTKSVASNASSARGIPTAIACKSKEDLQRSILDVLKKLKLRDKQIAGAPAHSQICNFGCFLALAREQAVWIHHFKLAARNACLLILEPQLMRVRNGDEPQVFTSGAKMVSLCHGHVLQFTPCPCCAMPRSFSVRVVGLIKGQELTARL